MNLRTKIILILIPFITLPIIILGVILFDHLNNYSQKISFVQTSALLNQVASHVQCHLDAVKENIEFFSASKLLANYLLIEDKARRYDLMQAPLLDLFSRYVSAYPLYYEIRVVLPNGYEDTRFTMEPIPNDLENEGNSTWFKSVCNSKNAIYSEFLINPDNQQLALLFSKKILLVNNAVDSFSQKPTLRGYLVLTIRPDFIANQTKENVIGQKGFLFFVNDEGRILGHHEKTYVFQKLAANKFSTMCEYVNKGIILKTELFGQMVHISGRKIASDLWCFVVLPNNHLVEARNNLKKIVSIITVITIFTSLFLTYFLLNWLFLNPIRLLSKVSQQVGQGNLNIKLENRPLDEIGVLFSSFNKMIWQIKVSKQALEMHHAKLESEVIERTRHLEIANQKLKTAQEKAELADQSKTNFLARMTHEIRTPINGIIGMVELGMERISDNDQVEIFRTIHSESGHLLNIINEILDYSKIEAGKIVFETISFDLKSLLDDLIKGFIYKAQKKGIQLVSCLPPDKSFHLIGDPGRLRQILINLISNAIKFTQKGDIVIKGDVVQENDDTMDIHFFVKDTGIGIPKDKQASIFDSFTQADESTTRKYGGTGLGTTIAKQLVELMGGKINLESDVNKGSTFWFTIPFQKQKIQETQLTKQDCDHPFITLNQKDISILLVEDYLVNQLVVKEHLQNAGYQVDLAENGLEAVEAFKRTTYDLILMDIEMPVMDGYQATCSIRNEEVNRKTSAPVTIIAMTAHALEGYREKSLQMGMDDFITKPLRRDGLLALVDKHIRRLSGHKELLEDQIHQEKTSLESKENDIQCATDAVHSLNTSVPMNFEVILDDFDGDKETLLMAIALFLNSVRNQLKGLHQAISDNDAERVWKEAHSIKGGAANLTATDLSTAAFELEKLGKSGNLETGILILQHLKEAFYRLENYILSSNFGVDISQY
ncbi:MAG: response regulator [Candidatus Magnetomorum sp.]|nr:response regulator [Candidatus Magnetomorum sp.]